MTGEGCGREKTECAHKFAGLHCNSLFMHSLGSKCKTCGWRTEYKDSTLNNLEKLLYLRGISAEYYDYSGERILIPWEDRLRLLRESGCDPHDDMAVDKAIFDLDARPWQNWLRPLHIVTQGESAFLQVCLHPEALNDPIHWQITTELESQLCGQFTPVELEEDGEYYSGDVRYSRRRLPIPNVEPGYHQVSLWREQRREQASLVVAPPRCYEGNSPAEPLWGISCQLYSIRSARNWGIGDYTDLFDLVGLAAEAGMDMIAINPIHAPILDDQNSVSPYSPSDRRFLNPLYIDPEQEEDFSECEELLAEFGTAQFRAHLDRLRAAEWVEYPAVMAVKFRVFAHMFNQFRATHLVAGTARAKAFHSFVSKRGASLTAFSEFESQHNHLNIDCSDDPVFHQYLQWLSHQQLTACQTLATERGMTVGLLGDLAVGAVREGAEVAENADLFCPTATIGAPPDQFSAQGQDWSLPALNPVAMRDSKFQHYIQLLRANMAPYGALRIDHILGLLRLWWCLPGVERGTYVYYPFTDLIRLLCLESQRNCCQVIGEDMGLVPDELRQAMDAAGVYSNSLFYFDRDHGQGFSRPESHNPSALLMVANHDVPTLVGWWSGTDISLQREIGLLDSGASEARAIEARSVDKTRLLEWLNQQQLLPTDWIGSTPDRAFDLSLCGAILKANARSRSKMMLFQLDDLMLEEKPVNIPGTWREYPNWRRKLKRNFSDLFHDPEIRGLLKTIYQQRKQ